MQSKKSITTGWLMIEAFGLALPELVAATKIWRRMYESEEQLSRDGLAFMKSELRKTLELIRPTFENVMFLKIGPFDSRTFEVRLASTEVATRQNSGKVSARNLACRDMTVWPF